MDRLAGQHPKNIPREQRFEHALETMKSLSPCDGYALYERMKDFDPELFNTYHPTQLGVDPRVLVI